MKEITSTEQAEIAAIVAEQEKNFRRKLASNRNKVFAIQLIRTLHGQIDTLAAHVKKKPTVHFDCKPGCSYCCTLRIEVVAPEVFLLAHHLSQLPEPDFATLIHKLKAHAPKATGVRMEDFFLQCPLLEDGKCSVYSVRPVMCRKYFSMDVEECKKSDVSAPEDSDMAMKSAALIYGTTKAYARATLPHNSHELGQALLLALTDRSAEDRWYRGETIFEAIPEQIANEP